MSFNIGKLFFSASTPVFIISVLALLAILALCIIAIKRSARKKRTGLLELLRFLCILFVVALLWQAEWHTELHTQTQPEVLVLFDESKSMDTLDTRVSADGITTTVVSRKEAAKQLLENDSLWKEIKEKNTVIFQGFSNPENTAIANESGSDLASPLNSALETHSNLRAAVLLSDGDWNQGQPPVTAAQKLRSRNIPLYTIPLGNTERMPDLEFTAVNAPTYGIMGEKVQIPFTIRSSLNRDVRTIVRLRNEHGKERNKDITIPAKSEYFDSMLWTLDKEGSSSLEISIPVTNGEEITKNNSQKFNISARQESIKVLVIESEPRWEYRFIRNALSRDPGVEVDCLLLHPKLGAGDGPNYIQEFPEELEDLQKYDVVFLGDIGISEDQLTLKQTSLLRGLIENQASGIVFIPGSRGFQTSLLESPLGELMPVILDEKATEGLSEPAASPMRLTTEGRDSLLTMLGDTEEENPLIWRNLPGFFWHAAVIKAKGGSSVLAVHNARRNEFGRIPLIVTREFGSGKVLFMGIDSAWRWRRGVEDLYHYRFWGQVARWMSYQRNIARGERVRVFYTPERPAPGDTITFNANAFSEKGAPLKEGEVVIDITRPDDVTERIQLLGDNGDWGSYSGRFRMKQSGEYKIRCYVTEAPDKFVENVITVQGTEIEKIGQAARPKVLEELSRITKGQMMINTEASSLMAVITDLPDPQPLVDRLSLWSHWISAATLITLLGIFWIGRKFNGTF